MRDAEKRHRCLSVSSPAQGRSIFIQIGMRHDARHHYFIWVCGVPLRGISGTLCNSFSWDFSASVVRLTFLYILFCSPKNPEETKFMSPLGSRFLGNAFFYNNISPSGLKVKTPNVCNYYRIRNLIMNPTL